MKEITIAIGLVISNLPAFAIGAELTAEEKMEYIVGSSSTCVAKNNAGRILSAQEQAGVKRYCACAAGVMASLVTREEMLQVQRGRVPPTLQPKVDEARKRCIDSLR